MEIDAGIQAALKSANPLEELRWVIRAMLDAGQTREGVLKRFEQNRQQLRDAGREVDEDVLMDAMDFLSGWCSPQLKLPVDKQG